MYDKRKTMMLQTHNQNRHTHSTCIVDTVTCVRKHYGGRDIFPL